MGNINMRGGSMGQFAFIDFSVNGDSRNRYEFRLYADIYFKRVILNTINNH